ncbi:carboxymuconolactone decarboxylase family protein [Magnetococcales bacterium HHB-1]
MALIKLVRPEEATGEVAEIFKKMESFLGHVPEAQKLYAVSPGFLQSTVSNITRLMAHPIFSKSSLLAWARLLIAGKTRCAYCVGLNEWLLMEHHGFSLQQIEKVRKNPQEAPLDKDAHALLMVILKVMRDSNSLTVEDMESLKALGWSEVDIFEAIAHATQMVGIDLLLNAFHVRDM